MRFLKYLGTEVKKRSCLSQDGWLDGLTPVPKGKGERGEVAGVAGLERKSGFVGYSFCLPCFGAVLRPRRAGAMQTQTKAPFAFQ